MILGLYPALYLPRHGGQRAANRVAPERLAALQTQGKTVDTEIPRAQRRAAAPALTHFVKQPERNRAMAQAYATGCYSLKEIGQAFGLHYATVSRLVRAVEIESE